MLENLRTGTLIYHRLPKPGKLEIQPIKPLGNQRDLALAYSPGVAALEPTFGEINLETSRARNVSRSKNV